MHGLETSAIRIAGEFGVLDKCTRCHKILELLGSDEEILLSIDLPRPWRPSGVFFFDQYQTESDVGAEEGRAYERH